jgi:gentisate 1,2-dioxygenase
MENMFLENYPGGLQTAVVPSRRHTFFRGGMFRPLLDKAAEDPQGLFGRRVELGSPAMTTMGLYMQRHRTGTRTRRFQTTANLVYCVVEGHGTTTVDGDAYRWVRGDVMAASAWRPFEHAFSSDATLFSMTDEPAFRLFGWLRTQIN